MLLSQCLVGRQLLVLATVAKLSSELARPIYVGTRILGY